MEIRHLLRGKNDKPYVTKENKIYFTSSRKREIVETKKNRNIIVKIKDILQFTSQ